MRFCVLGSGSKGNSTYIESGDTGILIDAGFSGIEIERRLTAVGVDISMVSAILVTHEHTDHIRGVAVLSRRHGLPVYVSSATRKAANSKFQKLSSCEEFSPGTSFLLQDIKIHPFSVSHDAADPVGFIVDDGRYRVGYCTDTGMVSRLMCHRLGGCNGLILESNHDPLLLKNGPYPPALKQRVRSKDGHLANHEAVTFLADLMHDELNHVILAHISETNNRLEIVQQTVDELENPGKISISLALQDVPGEMIDLAGAG
ncbi:MBL fold metallo-hydrolase [Thermodesulfobacteriota bacterium]